MYTKSLSLTNENLAHNQLFAWGRNDQGELALNSASNSFAMVSTGVSHTVAIDTTGKLWAWGVNNYGQVGNGTTNNYNSPVQIGFNTNWRYVSAGTDFSVAINSVGAMFTWGLNTYSQLGDGSTINKSNPVQISSSNSWSQVSAGGSYAVALTTTNTLWGWGDNTYGQVGSYSASLPVQIGSSSWAQISAGSSTAFGLLAGTRALYGWGTNINGQMGIYSSMNLYNNVTLVSSKSWVSVSAGASHALALDFENSMWAWGDNTYGELGDSTTISKSSPVQVTANGAFLKVFAGNNVSAGINSHNFLFTWGLNNNYMLGTNDTVYRSSPTQIGASSWTQVSVGASGVLAMQLNRTLYAWGANGSGQLGTNNGTTYGSPVLIESSGLTYYSSPVSIGSNSWKSISSGLSHTIAVRSDGTLWGWGVNNVGQLGTNNTAYYSSPVQIGAGSWTSVAAGDSHSVAIDNVGKLWSWGNNATGQLGYSTAGTTSSPQQIGSGSWSQVTAGTGFTAGRTSTGTLFVWGYNGYGQIGNGTTTNYSSPVQVGTSSWNAVSAGQNHVLALDKNNTIWAWGINTIWQLGDGTIVSKSSPVQISTSSWTAISAGTDHSVAVRNDGTLWTWGNNAYGQLGLYSQAYNWLQTTEGYSFTAAIRSDRTLWTWGLNTYGQLGTGDTVTRSSPVQIGTSSWSQVYAGGSHMVAIDTVGRLFAWGLNNAGQLGTNNSTSYSSPLQVGTSSWSQVRAGDSHTIAIRSDNTLWTWGNNATGQLSTNDTVNRSSPVQVTSSPSSSIAFTGSQYINVASTGNWDFLHNGTPWYCQFWVYFTSSNTSVAAIFSTNVNGAPGYIGQGFLINNNTGYNGATYNVQSNFTNGTSTTFNTFNSGTNLVANQWNYVAFVFNGTTGTFYINGALSAGTNITGYTYSSLPPTANLTVGAGVYQTNYTAYLNGSISNLLIGQGTAPSNISTVPTMPLYASSYNVRLLLNNGIYDNSLWNNAVATTGTPTVSSSIPFGAVFTSSSSPVQISAGAGYSLALRSDNTLWGWGLNTSWQVAQASAVNYSVPVQIGPGTSWTSLSAGYDHGAAIDNTGKLWSWGNPNSAFVAPTQFSWNQVSGGNIYSAAIRSDGSLWAWGDNGYGNLGNQNTIARSSPVQISVFSWNQVTTGSSHALAIRNDSTLWAWGLNNYGQMGTATTTYYSSPVQIGTSSWNSVGAGYDNTLGVDNATQQLWYWGNQASVPIYTHTTSWTAISAFVTGSHVLAVRADGTLWTWGFNGNGQLGTGDTANRSSPVQIGTSSWIAVAAGYAHSLAIRKDNTLWAWGYNGTGQLGTNNQTQYNSPVQITTYASWKLISAGYDHSIGYATSALVALPSVYAWGGNTGRQLGDGTSVAKSSPVYLAASGIFTSTMLSISAGQSYSMYVNGAGKLFANGLNQYGQLGFGNTTVYYSSPVQIGASTSWAKVFAGLTHTAAIDTSNNLWTWGVNNYGQLGQNSTTSTSSPSLVTVNGSNLTVSGVALGPNHTITVATNNTLWTWGDNIYGQLGHGITTRLSSPVQVAAAFDMGYVNPNTWNPNLVAVGGSATIVGSNSGILYAWGSGGLGNGIFGNLYQNPGGPINISRPIQISNLNYYTSSPVQVGNSMSLLGSSQTWSNVYSNNSYAVALKTDNTLWTWGTGVGTGITAATSSPVQVGAVMFAPFFNTGNYSTNIYSTLPYGTSSYLYTFPTWSPADFTVECWVKPSSSQPALTNGYTQMILGGTTWALSLSSINSSGTKTGIRLDGNSGTNFITSNVYIPTDVWSHIAVTRQSSGLGWTSGYNYNLFVNGVLRTQNLASSTAMSISSQFYIGCNGNAAFTANGMAGAFTGFISRVRVISNQALYQLPTNVIGTQYFTPYINTTGVNFANTVATFVLTPWYAGPGVQALTGTVFLNSLQQLLPGLGSSGWNDQGPTAISLPAQIGFGANTYQTPPISMYTDSQTSLTPNSWVQVAAGYDHVVALRNDNTVWTWGNYASINLIYNSYNWKSLVTSNSSSYTIAIRSDNSVWAWGANPVGNLGTSNASGVNLSSPTLIAWGGYSSWTQVSAGFSTTFGIRSDGLLYAWGGGAQGDLGLSNTSNYISPVLVGTYGSTALSWSMVSAGTSHAAGIDVTGKMWAWGYNSYHQLGIGSTTAQNSPVNVSNTNTGSWTMVSAGQDYTIAIDSNKNLWAWGNPATLLITTPNYSWSQISTGFSHTLAVRSDNTLWAWGNNSFGQLGSGTTANQSSPVQIGTRSGWTSITAGDYHSAAIGTWNGNSLFVWGQNSFGQIGNSSSGASLNQSSPVQIGTNSWKMVSAGVSYTLGIDNNNRMWGWGVNTSYQLGVGSITLFNSPVQVGVGLSNVYGINWAYVSAGQDHALAIDNNNYNVWTWGNLNSTFALTLPYSWTQISSGGSHVIAVRSDQTLWGWGLNINGQLGDNTTTAKSSPVQIGSTLSPWATVAAGLDHSIAVTAAGIMYAWGNGNRGQLGTNNTNNYSSPQAVTFGGSWSTNTGANGSGVSISAGTSFSVGIDSTGKLWAWGYNNVNQLGNGTTVNTSSPINIGASGVATITSSTQWQSVSVGYDHVLAIDNNNYRLWAWGNQNSIFGMTVPNSWTQVSIGSSHTLAIDSNNNLWAWGYNVNGQLGIGNTIARSSPVIIGVSNAVSWSYISAGDLHSMAINNNTIYVWGSNSFGQLGSGTTTQHQSSPIQIPSLNPNSWNQVAAGSGYSLALRNDNTIWAWGLNTAYQLGNGTNTNQTSPVQIAATGGAGTQYQNIGGWVSISAGYDHALAIDNSNYNVWTWGNFNSAFLVTVPQSWTQISIGSSHTVGIRSDNTLWAWGYNNVGQLGDNTTISKSSPVQVAHNLSPWQVVAAGDSHTLAIGNNGILYAWGNGNRGQLGTNNTNNYSSPQAVTFGGSWLVNNGSNGSGTTIAAGTSFSVGLDSNNNLWTWGYNNVNQLGIGTGAINTSTSSPVQIGISPGFNNNTSIQSSNWWQSVSASSDYAVAIDNNTYSIWAWGNPTSVFGMSVPTSWSQVSAGSSHTLAIDSSGNLWGWGYNSFGQLGIGNTITRSSPVLISSGTSGNKSWALVTTGDSFSAACTNDNNGNYLYTWGYNTNGQLGTNDIINRSSPVQISVPGGATSWNSVSAGSNFMIATGTDNRMWAWGINTSNQLGDGTNVNKSAPTQIGTSLTNKLTNTNGSNWSQVSAGYDHSLAIDGNGWIYTWGNPLSTGGTAPMSWQQISVGPYHALAIRSDQTLWAWGLGTLGQLGKSDSVSRSSPVQVGTSNSWNYVSAGAYHSLAIDNSNNLWTWGDNTYGELGLGVSGNKNSPTQVPYLTTSWYSITAGGSFTMAIDNGGNAWAWGYNNVGQLGDGTTINKSSPVQVGISTLISATGLFSGGWSVLSSNKLGSLSAGIQNGNLYAWGYTTTGQIGNNVTTVTALHPQLVGAQINDVTGNFGSSSIYYTKMPSMVPNFNAYSGGVSCYFDGNADQVSFATSNKFDLSNANTGGNWTIEFWMYPLTIPPNGNQCRIILIGNNGSIYSLTIAYTYTSAGVGGISVSQPGVGTPLNAPGCINGVNQWYHVAVVYQSSSQLSIYINGGLVAGPSAFTAPTSTSGTGLPLNVGYDSSLGATYQYNGFISSLRVTSGVAVYTSNFSPSGPLSYNSNTALLTFQTLGMGSISTSWSSVAAGESHVLAIDSSGTLWAWGDNTYGELGSNNTTSTSLPIQVSTSSWTSVFAGYGYSLAYRADNTLWAWGLNSGSQLGLGNTTNYSSPVQVSNVSSISWLNTINNNVPITISAGYSTAMAIRNDNMMYVWGTNNAYGIFGTNQISPTLVSFSSPTILGFAYGVTMSTPMQITDTNGGFNVSWTTLSAGYSTSAAINNTNPFNGALFVWGYNAYGQLGTNDTINRSSPTQISGSWTQVSAGYNFMNAITSTGLLYAWGLNSSGQLGQNNTTNYSSPVQVTSASMPTYPAGISTSASSWTQVSSGKYAGGAYTMSIRNDRLMYAYGTPGSGALGLHNVLSTSNVSILGYATGVPLSTPMQITSGNSWSMVSAGVSFITAIRNDKTLWVWGLNSSGQLGTNDTINRSSPTQIPGSWIFTAAGYGGAYGVQSNGTVWGWGIGGFVGNNTGITYSSPVLVSNLTGSFTQVWANQTNTILNTNTVFVNRNDNMVWGWGRNDYGQVGVNTNSPTVIGYSAPVQLGYVPNVAISTPTQIPTNQILMSNAVGFNTLSAGYSQSAAIASDNSLWMWGINYYGQIGTGDTFNRSNPVQVTASKYNFSSYFNGSANLSIVSNSAFAMSGQYTIETWIYIVNAPTSSQVCLYSTGSGNYFLQYNNTSFSIGSSGSSAKATFNYSFTTNNWYYIAVTRDGSNNTRGFVNGVLISTVTTDTTSYGQGGVTIGSLYNGTQSFTGYISNFRLVTGSALYNATFTPTTVPLTAVSGTQLLTCQTFTTNNVIVDNSANNFTIVNNLVTNSTQSSYKTVPFVGNLWSQVASGNGATLALTTNGLQYGWGYNNSGQLGTGNTTSTSTPVLAPTSAQIQTYPAGISTNANSWYQVATGKFTNGYYSMSIRNDNMMFVYGSPPAALGLNGVLSTSNVSILGYVTGTTMSTPMQIASPGGSSYNMVMASAGYSFSSAIRNDQTLYTWGLNTQGQLGVGDTSNRSSPTQISGSWISVAAGYQNAYGIRSNGTVWGWGVGSFVGNNTTNSYSSPVAVTGLTGSYQMIVASIQNTVGTNAYIIKNNGLLWSWGYNTYGEMGVNNASLAVAIYSQPVQLGYVSGVSTSTPVQITLGASYSVVSAGLSFSAGIQTNQTLWMWGSNPYGQLGTNDVLNRSIPTQIAGSWTAVRAAYNFTIAATNTGRLFAWGLGTSGQLGTNNNTTYSSPVLVSTGQWSVVSGWNLNAASIRGDGTLWLWGLNSPQLGMGSTVLTLSSPTLIGNLINASYPTQIGVNSSYTVAGINNYTFPTSSWSFVSATVSNTAAIDANSNLWLWGNNTYGQLGDGTTITKSYPVQIPGSWIQVSVGSSATAAINTQYQLYTWGYNAYGQLGTNNTTNYSSPIQIPGSWSQITAGTQMAGTTTNGVGYVWGYNNLGQLGLGNTINYSSPIALGITQGINTYTSSPVQVGFGSSYVAVGAGRSFSYAMDAKGIIWSWGYNGWGQLGTNDTISRSSPTQVAGNLNATIGSSSNIYSVIFSGATYFTAGSASNWTFLHNGTAWYTQFWIYYTSTSTQTVFATNISASNTGLGFLIHSTSYGGAINSVQANFTNSTGSFNTFNSGPNLKINTWNYVSFVFNGTTGIFYINSIQSVGANTTGNTYAITAPTNTLAVGAGNNAGTYASYLAATVVSNLVIGQGNAPTNVHRLPVFPFTNATGVQLLTCQNSSIIDNSSNAYTLTVTGNATPVNSPTYIPPIFPPVSTSFGGGYSHMTILNNQSQMYEAGLGNSGQLGQNNTTAYQSIPTQIGIANPYSPVLTDSGSWTQVSAGTSYTLGIKSNALLYAWGLNNTGQIGTGDTFNRSSPTQIGTNSWTQVSASQSTGMALDSSNNLWGWGLNTSGQMGIASTNSASTPTQIGGQGYPTTTVPTRQLSPYSWTQVSAGNSFTLGINNKQKLFAWGVNSGGQVGDGSTINKSLPTQIGISNWSLISAGGSQVVAVTT